AMLPALIVGVGALGVSLAPFLLGLLGVEVAIAAVVVAGVLLIKHWDWVKAHLDLFIAGIAIAASIIFGPMVIAIGGLIIAGRFLVEHWGDISAAFFRVWGGIRDFFVNVWDFMRDHAIEIVTAIGAAILGPIVAITVGVIAAITWLATNWEEIWGRVKDTFNAVVDTIGGIKDRLVGLFVGVFNFIHDTWDAVWRGIENTFDRIVGNIGGIKDRLVGLFVGVFDFIGSAWSAVWTTVHNEFDRIVGLVLGIRDRLVGGFKAMAGMIGDPLAGVWSMIQSGVDNVIGLMNRAIDLLNKAIETYNQIPLLPDIPPIPNIGGSLPQPGDPNFIGPMMNGIRAFATGGTVPGPMGQAQLAVVHGGEEVLTPAQRRTGGRGGGNTYVTNITF
ncbi:MAG: hypothetical protein Q7R41_05210, partial [Phycisphaerales bacterium]|nr:hypothetical protein [Phycisphaerales bacterium]